MIYETKHFNPGDFIVREDEIGKGFFILEDGELEVIRNEKVLNEINLKGAMFGELSELLMNKRDASIRAKTAAIVKFFDMGLQTFVEKNPRFAVKIIRNLGRRLCRMNSMALKGNTRNDFLRNIAKTSASDEEGRTVRLLVVDDKSMIVDQVKSCVSVTGWKTEGAENAEEALELCEEHEFCAIVISCSLPDDAAVDLRRKLKTNPKSSKTPVVGMLIKGDENAHRLATDSGFSHFIYKPIDKGATLTTLYEVLSLDASDQYFDLISDTLCFKVPATLSTGLVEEIKGSYKPRIRNTINDGIEKVIIDVSKITEVGEDSVELVGDFADEIEEVGSPFKIGFVAQGEDADMWKNLDGCEEAEIFETLEEAISGLSN